MAILLKAADSLLNRPAKFIKGVVGAVSPNPSGDADILDLERRCKCMSYDPMLEEFYRKSYGKPGQLLSESDATAALAGLRAELGRLRRAECQECALDQYYDWDKILIRAQARGTESIHKRARP